MSHRDDIHVHVHVHLEGQGEIMGILERVGTTADELAANVSQFATDARGALGRIEVAVDLLRQQVAAGALNEAAGDRIIGVLESAKTDLASTAALVEEAGNDPGSPVPPVEEPPVEEPPVEEPPVEEPAPEG